MQVNACCFQIFSHNENHELDTIESDPFCTLQKLRALKYCCKLISKILLHINLGR